VSADAVLVAAARRGDRGAFAELYRAHAPAVARRARTRASREEQVVADVVQEVFTRAFEGLDRLRDPARFGAWVGSIADHVIADHHRTGDRIRRLDEATARRLEARETGPDGLAEARELAAVLRRSLAGLPPRDARALALVGGLDLSPGELGAALGVSRGAAKVLVHRARKRLRSSLALQLAG
jgi:RNA polymerase sigma factor (sigma-70 family)